MRYQVAIVGGGPIGTLLGNLLGRRGVSTCVIEKRERPYDLPRAVHFDGEAMRVFQAAGLTDEIMPSTMVGRGMLFKTMDDELLIDWSRDQQIGPMGWYESYRVHQPGLEAALTNGLTRFPNVSVVLGDGVTGVEQEFDSVWLRLDSGDEVNAEYVVGCDGATSMLRSLLGIENDELGFEERWLVVDLLLQRPRDDLGDYSIQFCDPDNPATYVRGVGDRRRWEMRLKDDDPDQVSEDLVWERLKHWIGPDDASLERSAVYTFRSIVAEGWQNGRCFVAGDAAHQMPPFMGQGMCAGIRDAGNLAWKLDYVLKGADPELLTTYHGERQHNVRQFIELSVRLGKLINQSATGSVPKGQMKSIWPSLGPGLGVRDDIGGELAPQVRTIDGILADEFAQHGFYVLSSEPMECSLPVVVGKWDKLEECGARAAVIRPDGYALGRANNAREVEALMTQVDGA